MTKFKARIRTWLHQLRRLHRSVEIVVEDKHGKEHLVVLSCFDCGKVFYKRPSGSGR